MRTLPFSCAVTSCGHSVNIYSSRPVYDLLVEGKFLYRHTGLSVLPDVVDTPYEVHYVDSEILAFDFGREQVSVQQPWSEMLGGEILLFLAYPYIEAQLQAEGFVTAHSACVEMPDGRAVLLLGKEGAGKTSIAVRLCQAGGKLVGNDLVVIGLDEDGRLMAKVGSQFFFLRYKSVERAMPDLLRLFGTGALDTWLYKKPVMPAELGVAVTTQPVEVKAVYLVHVDNLQQQVFTKNADSVVTRLFLNENFSRYIRSTCTTLMTGPGLAFSGYIPSLDRPEFYKRRVLLMGYMLNHLGVRYVSGPLSDIVAHILKDDTIPP